MPSSRSLSNKVGVSNAYFTLPNPLLQSDHLSPVKGESESSRSWNRSHIKHAGFSSSAKDHMLVGANRERQRKRGHTCLKLGRMKRKEHGAEREKYISVLGKTVDANLK